MASSIHPVLLITFNRPEHTEKSLNALLKQNPDLLYVFRDGPREGNRQDQENCTKVREIVERSLKNTDIEYHTYFSPRNRGCRDAVIFAITEVLKKHDSVIIVEDDIIASPAFLSFMNQALDYYESRKTVFSISGFSHSPARFRVPEDYPYDVFASPRLFNWGWATWKDRWEQTDWSFSYYDRLVDNPSEVAAFNRGGEDLFPMLKEEHDGKSSAWDIQFEYAHFANHAVSIVPCHSYTKCIGEDGSGTHCIDRKAGPDDSTDDLCMKDQAVLTDNLYFDARIINAQSSLFCRKKRPLWQKGINFIMRKLGKKPPFTIKKRYYA